jgi:predicted esterase
MGAFLTGQLLGTHPAEFRAASHTAGGVSSGVNATKESAARNIRTPYQLHHGDADRTVDISQDRTLDRILTEDGVPHELRQYPGFSHEAMALDATMFDRVREWYRVHGVL